MLAVQARSWSSPGFRTAIIASVFWLWMLIDALVYEPTTEQKILWFLVVFFLHFIGALIYFFVRRAGRSSATRVGY